MEIGGGGGSIQEVGGGLCMERGAPTETNGEAPVEGSGGGGCHQ